MRISLKLRRPDYPTLSINSDVPSNTSTVLQFLAYVDTWTTLESSTLRLEDYKVKCNGSELILCADPRTTFTAGDEISIRPLSKKDVKLRKATGRDTVKSNGKRFVDGIPYGARGLKRKADHDDVDTDEDAPAAKRRKGAGAGRPKRVSPHEGRGDGALSMVDKTQTTVSAKRFFNEEGNERTSPPKADQIKTAALPLPSDRRSRKRKLAETNVDVTGHVEASQNSHIAIPSPKASSQPNPTSPNPKAPGEGKQSTKSRNKRRKLHKQHLRHVLAEQTLSSTSHNEDSRPVASTTSRRESSHIETSDPTQSTHETLDPAISQSAASEDVPRTKRLKVDSAGLQGSSSERTQTLSDPSPPAPPVATVETPHPTVEAHSSPGKDSPAGGPEGKSASERRLRVDMRAFDNIVRHGLGMGRKEFTAKKEASKAPQASDPSPQESLGAIEEDGRSGTFSPSHSEDEIVERVGSLDLENSGPNYSTSKIEVKATECVDHGVPRVSVPPFPFAQHWGQENQELTHIGDSEELGHDEFVPQNIPEHGGRHHLANSANTQYSGSDTQSQPSAQQQNDQSPGSQAVDLPIPPADTSDLPVLTAERCLPGAIICYKHLEISQGSFRAPGLSPLRPAKINEDEEDSQGSKTLRVTVASRDRCDIPQRYDSYGNRVLGLFDSFDADNGGRTVLEFDLLIEPHILQPSEQEGRLSLEQSDVVAETQLPSVNASESLSKNVDDPSPANADQVLRDHSLHGEPSFIGRTPASWEGESDDEGSAGSLPSAKVYYGFGLDGAADDRKESPRGNSNVSNRKNGQFVGKPRVLLSKKAQNGEHKRAGNIRPKRRNFAS